MQPLISEKFQNPKRGWARGRSGSFLFALFLALQIPLAIGFETPDKDKTPRELRGVGITEKLGQTLPLEQLTFKDEAGQSVKLSQYFHGSKPVLLNLVYFECPNLCTFLLNGLLDSLKPMDWTPGNQFEIVSVSINPQDTPELATKKKQAYIQAYGRPGAAAGWHFLTSPDESQVKKLADSVGFQYKYDELQKQYAHTAALFVITPDGKISRYLYGIQFSEKDLRFGLLEASNGKIGSVVERFLMFCYHYDPQLRTYSVYVTRLMQVACALTVLILGGYLLLFWRKQRLSAIEVKLGA